MSSYFDATAWIGSWPFAFLDAHTPRSLVAHLGARGIQRALVSPLEAVFAPEPGPANRALLRTTRAFDTLTPVPVINPTLGNWREELALCARDPRVRVVRVLPSYHRVALTGVAGRSLVSELSRLRLKLVVQVRLIDERHEYHGLNLKPVATRVLAQFLEAHRDTPVLLSGLLRSEILKLAPDHPNLLADLSFAEWHDTLRDLLTQARIEQLAFASHTPFLVTAAATAKVQAARLTAAQRRGVAGLHLDQFLQP